MCDIQRGYVQIDGDDGSVFSGWWLDDLLGGVISLWWFILLQGNRCTTKKTSIGCFQNIFYLRCPGG